MKRALFLALLLTGCGGAAADAWLSSAEEAQHLADIAFHTQEWDAGREPLEAFVKSPVPAGVRPEDALLVRRGAFARLAELSIAAKQWDSAQSWADQGLALGGASDVTGASLHVARGRAHEALGHDAEAVADLHDALVIDEALLKQLVPEAQP